MNLTRLLQFIAPLLKEWVIFVIALIVIGIAYAYKLYEITRPELYIVLNVLVDDAYYYFEIARNIVLGHGSTFDQIAPTNGYHPLWMLLLLPVWFFFGASPTTPLYIVLGMSLALDVAATYLLYRIVRTITTNGYVIAATLLVWVLNPYNYFNIINGLETPLGAFLVLLFILTLLKVVRLPSLRNYGILGAVAGLMMLSRTDYVVIAGAPFILWLIYSRDWSKFKHFALYLLVGSLFVIPWLAWNQVTFGSVVQTSGAASTVLPHQYVDFANQAYHPAVRFVKAMLGEIANGIPRLLEQTGAGLLSLVIAGTLTGFILGRRREGSPTDEQRTFFRVLIAITLTIAIFCFVTIGLRWSFRIWYFIPLVNLVPTLWLAYGLTRYQALRTPGPLQLATVVVSTLAVLLVAFSFFFHYWKDYREMPRRGVSELAWQEAIVWIDQNVPEGERVGAFNSGTLGYFATRPIVNLDGLVNNHAYEAIRDKRLYAYIADDLKLNYIVDFDRAIFLKFQPSWEYPEEELRERIIMQELIYGPIGTYDPVGMAAFKVLRD